MTTPSNDSLITSLLLIEILRMIPRQRKITTRQIQQQLAIEDTVEVVCANPSIGDAKVQDLQGIFVYKW